MSGKNAILATAVALICFGPLSWAQAGEPGVVTGTVAYLQRSALPPWLLDKKNCLIIKTGEGFCRD